MSKLRVFGFVLISASTQFANAVSFAPIQLPAENFTISCEIQLKLSSAADNCEKTLTGNAIVNKPGSSAFHGSLGTVKINEIEFSKSANSPANCTLSANPLIGDNSFLSLSVYPTRETDQFTLALYTRISDPQTLVRQERSQWESLVDEQKTSPFEPGLVESQVSISTGNKMTRDLKVSCRKQK